MGKHKVKITLTENEYKKLSEIMDDTYEKLSKMTPQERKDWYMDRYNPSLNFKKKIDGTVYLVRTYFNPNASEAIFDKVSRLIEEEK